MRLRYNGQHYSIALAYPYGVRLHNSGRAYALPRGRDITSRRYYSPVDQNEFTYSPGIYTAAYNCLVDRYQCYVCMICTKPGRVETGARGLAGSHIFSSAVCRQVGTSLQLVCVVYQPGLKTDNFACKCLSPAWY